MKNPQALRFGALVVAVLSVNVAGCSALPKSMPRPHWPWARQAPTPEPRANQVAFANTDGTAAADLPQYWQRNTLVVDLTGLQGSGSLQMRAKASMGWPVRMALRVKPGSVGQLEVLGESRVVIPVVASGAATIDLPLAPSVYAAKTAVIVLTWGPAAG